MRKYLLILFISFSCFSQSGLIARQNFGGKTVFLSTNTEIGGVASTISTPALLATKLAIDVSRISNFSIVGSDIKCKITGSYPLLNNTFLSDTAISFYIDTDGLVSSIGASCFNGTTNIKIINFKNCTTVSGFAFLNSNINTVILQNCNNVAGNSMFFSTSIQKKYIYIPVVTTLGSTSGNDNVFSTNTNIVVYTNPFLATNNAGSPDGDLQYTIGLGNTVRYVNNYSQPNNVTSLVSGVFYPNAVELNFTEPTGSVNAIEFYEIYVNGVFNNASKYSGGFAINLSPSTYYTFTVVSVDIFYNKSTLSNSISFTTPSTVTFQTNTDTDANAYISASGISTDVAKESSARVIVDLKKSGLWSKVQSIYLFKGSSSNNQKYNAKNPVDSDSAFRLVFAGSATFSDLGYQLNGSSYANTKFIPSVNQSLNSHGVTLVCGTNNNAYTSDTYEFGSEVSASQSYLLSLKNNNSNYQKVIRLNGTYATIANGNESRGIFTAVKQSSTVSKLIRNNTTIINTGSGGTLPNIADFIGSVNLNGSPYGYSSQRIQMVILHEGLSDSEIDILNSIINLSETIAGRKTW